MGIPVVEGDIVIGGGVDGKDIPCHVDGLDAIGGTVPGGDGGKEVFVGDTDGITGGDWSVATL